MKQFVDKTKCFPVMKLFRVLQLSLGIEGKMFNCMAVNRMGPINTRYSY
jgi:hypothetical protein